MGFWSRLKLRLTPGAREDSDLEEIRKAAEADVAAIQGEVVRQMPYSEEDEEKIKKEMKG